MLHCNLTSFLSKLPEVSMFCEALAVSAFKQHEKRRSRLN